MGLAYGRQGISGRSWRGCAEDRDKGERPWGEGGQWVPSKVQGPSARSREAPLSRRIQGALGCGTVMPGTCPTDPPSG